MTPQELDQMASVVGSHERRLDQLTLLTERLIENQTILQDAVIEGQRDRVILSQVVLEIREAIVEIRAETLQLKAGQEQHQAMLLEILRQRP